MSFPRGLTALALVLTLAAPVPAPAAVPTPEQVRADFLSSEAVLLDRHGVALQSLRVDMTVRRLSWVALADISPALSAAVVQAEDQRFHQHGGVDIEAIGKAAWDNLFRSRPRGASTITMQLAALLDTGLKGRAGTRSWGQKWDQLSAARELEARWQKPQILEAYLNLVSFRGELQGIAAASQGLFSKAPSGLDQAESAVLASLIRAPNAVPRLVARRACGLAREQRLAVSCDGIESVAIAALTGGPREAGPTLAAQVAQKLLKTPSGSVPSTLDADVQRLATESLRQQLIALRGRNVSDGAVVVLDNRSGDILAYVGNAGQNSVDGVAALRQAGSTLKPFLYQLALERRLITAASILDDSPVDISTPAGLYVPQNYDKDFKGYASVRTSLGNSLNVPAVRTLLLTGMDGFYNRLRDLGLSTLTQSADYYGYSLALGSAEVSLLELSNAYRTLANGGWWGPVRLVPGGSESRRRVMDERAAFVVSDMLSDRSARSLSFGLSNDLATTFWSAVKTGTSKDMRDNWCVGFSDRYTVGVWVGNFDGQPMWDVSGVSGAAPVWRDVMDFLHKDRASRRPAAPAGVRRQAIRYEPQIEASRDEWFINGTESEVIEVISDAGRVSRIRYPGNGSIIAIDPDIPEPNQRLMFLAQAAGDLSWQLDGVLVGPAAGGYSWRPLPGRHELKLVSDDGKVVDGIGFQVRGAALPPAR